MVYGLPLFLAPLKWAGWFQWKLPQETDLTVYLGRCLGGLAVALPLACFRAAPQPAQHPLLFELIIAACGLLTVVHAWGAIKRTQPWTEDVEIVLYALVTGLAIWAYTGL